MTDKYLQLVVALAGVVALIFLTGFLYKKRQTRTGLITILAYQSFGPRKGLAAIKIGNSVLIIGVTPTDFRLLKTFNENELNIKPNSETEEPMMRLRRIREQLDEHK